MGNTYILVGKVEAVEPLATASKDLVDMGKKLYGAYSPVPVPSFNTAEGKRLYFPATGLRGSLRRALRDVLRDKHIERGAKGLLLDEHYLLTLGGIKGSGAEQRSTVAMVDEWRERNVLLSLFGAGDAGVLGFMAGKSSVGNAICEAGVAPMTLSGARSDDLFRDRGGLEFLVESEINELVARSEGNAKASVLRKEISQKQIGLRNLKREGGDATKLEAELVKLNEKLEETLKTSNASSVSVGMPLSGFDAIPPFSVMEHTIKLHNVQPQELGGMLAALNKFSLKPVVGAHKSTGCGEIKATYEVLKVTDQGRVSVGEVSLGGFEPMQVIRSTEELSNAIEAFKVYLEGEDFDISVPYAI